MKHVLCRLLFALACLTAAGCGDSKPRDPHPHDGSATPDASSSLDAAVEAGTDPHGEYDVGPYHCCAEGAGAACCDGYGQGLCFEFGGIYGACRGAGEELEGKVVCAKCCEGLITSSAGLAPGDSVPPEQDGLPDGCDSDGAPPSLLVCLPCGNGACEEHENFCNCPADCSR